MSEKKKAPTSAATLKGAVENGRVCKTVQSPTSEHTTSPAENQPFRIADLLHPGAKNAIPRRDMMALTGLSDRGLRLMIETERRRGIPILSDNICGYSFRGIRRSVTAASGASAAGRGRSRPRRRQSSMRRYRCGRR